MDPFFDYDLPPELIAQQPAAERDQSRLLVVRRSSGELEHRVFADLPDLLDPADLLVLNDTQVVPARLRGRRTRTGGKWEGLFLRAGGDGLWELIGQTRGHLDEGEFIDIDPGPLRLELIGRTPERHWLVRPHPADDWRELLRLHGEVPLPPYIRKGHESAGDRERYQTVYARAAGAVAAPTAGLHFTPRLFDRLAQRGIAWTRVTLHVGIGTFQPIQVADYRQHDMHAEWGELGIEAAEAICQCRERGGRVVAIGTTTVRLLESVAADGPLRPWSGDTRLFIHPPYDFHVVNALATNFHLPRSTLLLLVGAFAGVDLLRRAYTTAIQERYRFYSYGDAMLIL
jgi:S-adenosylmethionine:tRNA ribosyltransferase-isomerase